MILKLNQNLIKLTKNKYLTQLIHTSTKLLINNSTKLKLNDKVKLKYINLREKEDKIILENIQNLEKFSKEHNYLPLTNNQQYYLKYEESPRNILILSKPNNLEVIRTLVNITNFLTELNPQLNLIVEPHLSLDTLQKLPSSVQQFQTHQIPDLTRCIDLVITLGGDGTILHSSSLFNNWCPPIISFSMGHLGFLLPFDVKDSITQLTQLFDHGSPVLFRSRLECKLIDNFNKQIPLKWGSRYHDSVMIMNEINLHRGNSPHLTSVNCFIDDRFLTNGVADGLVVATPTGSTAYSLSAGGPIIHPSVQGMILTPICPRSLSFRPIILPIDSTLTLKMSKDTRTNLQLSVDGKDLDRKVNYGDIIKVKQSPYPMIIISKNDEQLEWGGRISEFLKWNQNFRTRQIDEGSTDYF